MFSIDLYSRIPIYQQIIEGIKRDILLGFLKEGEQIASIRQLSVELKTNPNTISKAYLELERLDLLSAAVGKGYFISEGAVQRIRDMTTSEQERMFLSAARDLASAGVSEEELKEKIHQIYEERTEKENEL